jgi:hypothetical protein
MQNRFHADSALFIEETASDILDRISIPMKERHFQPFANGSFAVICGRRSFLTIRDFDTTIVQEMTRLRPDCYNVRREKSAN